MELNKDRKVQGWCSRAAKGLRNRATQSELIFRKRLLDAGYRQFNFQKFFRDATEIAIADFYFPKLRLVIELDGSVHDNPEVALNDVRKDLFYKRHHLVNRVLHITNKQACRMPLSELKKLINEVRQKEILYCY